MSITTFKLTTSAATGTYPFSIGVGLAKGDATSIVTDLTNYQVVVKRTWNDGSIKHAIISGRAALTSNTPLTVSISSGTPPTGTNLTATDIQTAAPSASVQCGAIGTVNLSSLLASPVRTWVSGPEMVECHYRADVGGSTLLSVWFHVRLFADGRKWVRAIVENGYLDNGSGAIASNADQSYIPTVSIGGSTVYNNGGVALSHYKNTRYSVEGWIGGDPAIIPAHDVAYLKNAKFTPNYAIANGVSAATTAGTTSVANGGTVVTTLAGMTQTYTPMGHGQIEDIMGNTGFAHQIGLLPLWDALYVTTNADSRAWKALLAHSSFVNSYPIVWRSKSTNLAVKPSSFATWTLDGPNQGGTDTIGAGSLVWEANHHGSAGYFAYLLSGDYWHYETLLLQASLCYLCTSSGKGSGTSRTLTKQDRGAAWMLRTVGQIAAIAPDTEIATGQIAADYRALLQNNYLTHKSVLESADPKAWSGVPYVYNLNAYAPGVIAPWQFNFWAAVNGYISDLEPLSSMTDLNVVRDDMYKFVVGMLGQSGVTTDYSFTNASNYNITISASASEADWYQSWGAIYTATFGSSNSVASNALGGSGSGVTTAASTGYWGNILPAIAYAAQHGATGASAAWGRVTGATNYTSEIINGQTISWNDAPLWGVTPRSVIASTLLSVANSVQTITSSVLQVSASTSAPVAGSSMRVDSVSLISGSTVVGSRGLGVVASSVPSSGANGPSYLYNDLALPADASSEVRGVIETWPLSGTLTAYEDGSFLFSGAADGVYTFTYRLYVDGVDKGTATVTITIGTVNGSKRALVYRGKWSRLPTAELSTGVKPLVLYQNRVKVRLTTEGQPVVFDGLRYRLIPDGDLEI